MSENPQKENGHVDLANEIVEAMCRTYLTNYESRVLWAIFRKTYGWQKKEDWIALSQFQELTGLTSPHICRALKLLERRNIIAKRGNKIEFNKFSSQWKELPNGATNHSIAKRGKKSLPRLADTKDNVTNNNTTLTSSTGGAPPPVPPGQEKKDVRNPHVQAIIDCFKTTLKLPILDGTSRGNRYAAYRLWQKLSRVKGMTPERAMRNIVGAIQFAAENDFWKKRLTGVADLDKNIMKILQEAKAD